MWSAIFISISHCSTVTDVIDDGMIVVCFDMLSEVMIGVEVDVLSELILGVGVGVDVGVEMLPMTTLLEFVVEIAYTGDVSAGMFAVLVIDVVTDIDVDMFDDEDVNGLVAAMTPLDPTLSAPWEEPTPVC